MKKITILLFMGAMIHIAAFTTYAQTDCEHATITKVEREGNGNRINWTLPLNGEEVTISQGGAFGGNSTAIGPWNEIRSLGVYHRFTPEHLTAINGGLLSQVIFVPGYHIFDQQGPGHTHTIQIYSGGGWGEENLRHPGTLIASQELNNAALIFWEENTITLEIPITIDASQELWIGYFCTDIDTIPDIIKYCAGADAGPCNNGFGNIILYDNRWRTALEVFSSQDFNWVIKGIVQTVDDVTVNIHFNESIIATGFSGFSYFHNNPTGEVHCYQVEVNCLEGGVSPLSNEVCILGMGISEKEQSTRLTVYPNPANNELRITNYELRNGVIEIYDVFGRLQKAESRKQNGEKEIVIDVSKVAAGIYFIRLSDKKGFAVQRFIKE